MSARLARFAARSALASVIMLTACGQTAKVATAPRRADVLDLMIADDAITLSDCSPFGSLDGHRLVAFDADTHAVAEGYGPADPNAQLDLADALDDVIESHGADRGTPVLEAEAARWRLSAGTFRIDPARRTVELRFPGRTESYALLTPMPLQQDGCLLVVGAPANADLDRSLFGAPASEPPLD